MTNGLCEASPAILRLDIACVIPTLRTGGSERVLADLASRFATAGNRICIITLMAPDEAPHFPIAAGVDLIPVGGLGAATSLGSPRDIAGAAWRVRSEIKSRGPGVVLGFTTLGCMLAVLATRGLSLPVVAGERIDPEQHARRIGRLRARVRDALYARADHVVVQTQRARRALAWIPDARISIIANPVSLLAGSANPGQPDVTGRFRLLGIGRLDPQKGFDLLIAAFARLIDRYPRWDLVIYGEGPERAALEAMALQLSPGRVLLPGVTSDIEAALLGAHALAFPSRYEGFPNALAEAMAAGLPAIGFRGVSGVEDLIVTDPAQAVTGLVADPESAVDTLSAGLARLMEDDALRVALGLNARRHVAAFEPQKHFEQWRRLLGRVVTPRDIR